MTSRNKSIILVIGFIFLLLLIVVYFYTSNGLLNSKKVNKLATPIPTVLYYKTGIETLPVIIKTEESENKLLSSNPGNFPIPPEGQILSSYKGYVIEHKDQSAYGIVWKFENTNIDDVLEDEFMDEEKYPENAVEMNWIFDQPEDPSNDKAQLIRGHNKNGDYFWLSLLQQGRDVEVKLDFVNIP